MYIDLPYVAAHEFVAGVDEAGRGSLAGPVVAAAVILDRDNPISCLDDSKKLSYKKRVRIAAEIKLKSKAWSVGEADVDEIDALNILKASLLAMERAVAHLSMVPTWVVVDGPYCPDVPVKRRAFCKGDQYIDEISAASIIAKVDRDMKMIKLDMLYPEYGFAQHKGYPTRAHLSSLQRYGASKIHRNSFSPVRRLA